MNDYQNIALFVVDDSDLQRQFAVDVCRKLGTQVLGDFGDAATALNWLYTLATPPDIAVIDLEMPGMDGVEFARRIARSRRVKSVLILSSRDPALINSVGIMVEAEGLIVAGTERKPLGEARLKDCIAHYREALRSRAVPDKTADSSAPIDAAMLRAGIEQKQLTLAFQPKLRSRGLMLLGFEALARWVHPKHGCIGPQHFIPLAEQSGLIDELTWYLFDYALNCLADWQARGLKLELSFNLSPLSLGHPQLADNIERICRQHQVEPASLTLEVTESALFGDLASAIQTLAQLRLRRFGIAIDDYGSGFANAQQLTRVPASELKLDRTLVHNLAARAAMRDIVSSTVTLSQKLGMSTVAEGVELLADYQALLQLGVDQVQGFLFGLPMFRDDIPRWVSHELAQKRRQLQAGTP